MTPVEVRKRLAQRLQELKAERLNWVPHWKDLVEQIRPRSGRFLFSDAQLAGQKQHSHIINSTPLIAARTLAGGMMAGITSPSRPWFRLTTPNSAMAELDSVKSWLDVVEKLLRETMAKSNLYNALHVVYQELGTPGTAVLYVEEDIERGINCWVFPIGSYYLANGPSGHVDTLYRETSMTVGQMVRTFGEEKVSPQVRAAWKQGTREQRHPIGHCIEPRDNWEKGALGPKALPWASWWWEINASDNDGVLRESGYLETPFFAPRWTLTGEDVYGSSPGMDAVGDCRALQHLEKRKAQAFDKVVNPPMRAPSSLAGRASSILPGSVTYVDSVQAGQTFSPAMEISPQALAAFREEIQVIERRIDRAFYADLWLMLSQSDGSMTAREVSERREEKLQQLGPVLERLNGELLNPLIDRIFAVLVRRGEVPPPPQELQGQPLKVEYISIMAAAQKLLGTTGLERLTSFTLQAAAAVPSVLDKLDTDQLVDEYAAMLGTPVSAVRSDDAVQSIRDERQQAQQQQAQLQQAAATAQVAKTASEADTSGDNALTTMLQGMGAR